jgi:hypothetical protein
VIELGWGLFTFLCLGALVAWFWHDSLAARERANAAALDACARAGLQLLDGTVAFARLEFVRGLGGWLGLRRTYVFDYTAHSIERRQGFVILTRWRVESVGFAPGEDVRPTRAEQVRVEPPAPPPRAGASNVLDLDDWRARHRRPPRPSEWREDRGDRLQ